MQKRIRLVHQWLITPVTLLYYSRFLTWVLVVRLTRTIGTLEHKCQICQVVESPSDGNILYFQSFWNDDCYWLLTLAVISCFETLYTYSMLWNGQVKIGAWQSRFLTCWNQSGMVYTSQTIPSQSKPLSIVFHMWFVHNVIIWSLIAWITNICFGFYAVVKHWAWNYLPYTEDQQPLIRNNAETKMLDEIEMFVLWNDMMYRECCNPNALDDANASCWDTRLIEGSAVDLFSRARWNQRKIQRMAINQ